MNKIILIAVSAFILSSCDNTSGSGNIQSEKRTVGNFEGVQVSGSIDVEVKNGPDQIVEVDADDNILKDIVTRVEDGMLNVSVKPGMSFINTHAKVYVTAPVINSLDITGSGDITSKNTLKTTNKMSLNTAGSGDIKLSIDAPEVQADIAGSGDVTLDGKTKNITFSGSGSGDFKCKDLMSENASIDMSGSGDAHVYASVSLKAQTSGSGDVYYGGNPAAPSISKSGSGTVEPEK